MPFQEKEVCGNGQIPPGTTCGMVFSFLVFLVPQVCELLGPLLVDSVIPAVFNFLGL